ncbi:hypothetical protein HRbin30_02559 [bacterium HR30]|nr:hypothetical protein HRbin30_02559 [bacterium HR30]
MTVLRYAREDRENLAAVLSRAIAKVGKPAVAVLVCNGAGSASWILPGLDGMKIPYAAGGRWLFVVHPWMRPFLLGLKGLADDDPLGVACLLRRPFFPLSLEERVGRVVAPRQMSQASAEAWEAARECLRKLRVRANQGAPGAAALALAEQTAFLSHPTFFGSNREIEREMFWALLSVIEREAWNAGSDLMSFAPTLRSWLSDPAGLAAKLNTDARPGILRLLAYEELRSQETVDVLAVTNGKDGPSQILWSLRGDGWVRLARDSVSGSVDLRIANALIVSDEGPGSSA